MKLLRNLVVVFGVLFLVGYFKAPFDDALAADLRERGLIPEPLEIDTREELGQTSLAIALGGLRSVIAPMMNLGAHVDWENQEWFELERKYRTIVTLQPETRYYWTTAAWHLHGNAYADIESRYTIPEGRRNDLKMTFFRKGISFLEQGLDKNPDDWRLWDQFGKDLSQTYRPRDLARAADAFRTAHELSGNLQAQRQYVYAVCRVPGREAEAWQAARAMWQNEPNRRFISPRTIYFTMQNWAAPPPAERLTLEQIFGDPRFTLEQTRRVALIDLADYWFRQFEDYPVHGGRETINRLCDEFNVPPELHPLRFEWDRQFSIHPLLGGGFGTDPHTGTPRRRAWRSIWMDQMRDGFRPYVTGSPAAPLSLSILWLRMEKDYAMPGVHDAIEEVFRRHNVPGRFSPLRHHPAELVSEHPVTGQPFQLDPATGQPQQLTWEDAWTEFIRKDFADWLKARDP